MNKLELKHPAGWFAAGQEVEHALRLLSDGAFKLYLHVCLHADRRSGQLRFRLAELAAGTGHSVRSVNRYMEELRTKQVCLAFTANNQHEFGRIEICDRFWPYHKQIPDAAQDPEQALYISGVRALFLSPACVAASFSAADESLAGSWYRQGVTLDWVKRAILLGCVRKYMALAREAAAGPIASLQYFAGVVEEVRQLSVPMEYWRYVEAQANKMEAHYRAHANLASANSPREQQTK